MKHLGLGALGLVALLVLAACGGAPPSPPPVPEPAPVVEPSPAPVDSTTAAFMCPMPEDNFYSNEAGKCPKCGMDLVPNLPAGDTTAVGAGAAGSNPHEGHQHSGAGASTGGSSTRVNATGGACDHAGGACPTKS